MQWLESILTHVVTLAVGLGGGGSLVWAIRYMFKDRSEAAAASEVRRLAAIAADREYLVTQLRLSLQNEFAGKMDAQKLLESARDSLVELRAEVLEFKGKYASAIEENIRLKGELLQWQSRKPA